MELLQQIKDFLIPELDAIRLEQAGIKERLNAIDAHLIDQSRRIDAISQRVDAISQRIDETNKRIDETNKRIDETNKRIDKVQSDFNRRFDAIHSDFISRIDETHRRLDRLYEVSVRRDEHETEECHLQTRPYRR